MSPPRLPKMMLGFVVRRCTVDLGHAPTADELAAWANAGAGRDAHIFGRPITVAEAGLILRHQARLVSAASAAADERWVDAEMPPAAAPNVVSLAAVRARRAAGRER
ncbi:MAG: hypothetical protein U0802_02580 [Candidatus Binatia bacterium]